MPETILTIVIDWILHKKNKLSIYFKIYGYKCTILWSHWQKLEESQGQLGLGKDDANLNFKIDSSVWDNESWVDVIQQGKITEEEEKM